VVDILVIYREGDMTRAQRILERFGLSEWSRMDEAGLNRMLDWVKDKDVTCCCISGWLNIPRYLEVFNLPKGSIDEDGLKKYNSEMSKELEADLRSEGYGFIKVNGVFKYKTGEVGKERSSFVIAKRNGKDVPRDEFLSDMEALRRKYKQESILIVDGDGEEAAGLFVGDKSAFAGKMRIANMEDLEEGITQLMRKNDKSVIDGAFTFDKDASWNKVERFFGCWRADSDGFRIW
jgi:hypothetical protein